jgi:hypothetical protein
MIPVQHSEHLSRAFYALTIDPAMDILYYFVPFIGAWLKGYYPLVNDPSQEAMFPSVPTQFALRDIRDLTEAAGISRSITPCIGLSHYISSFGGKYSISQPTLMIPDQALYRKGNPVFGSNPSYQGNIWICSDDEVRFLLARELAHINMNNSLLRIAIKIAVVSAIIFVFSNPINGALATYILISALATYLFSERHFQSSSDLKAIDILEKYNIEKLKKRGKSSERTPAIFRNQKIKNALEIAISTLEKIRKQNLYFRENSFIAKIYISKSGNNYLDLLHPTLTSRIQKMQKKPRLAGA